MDVLAQLQRTLHTVNQVALARIRPGDSLQMLNEKAKMQEWLRGAAKLDDAPIATIEEVLRAFRQDANLKGLRQIQLACYGCTQSFGSDDWRLIENQALFEKLLDYVDQYRERRRTFRKLYRGLLNGYFSYDPDAPQTTPVGRSNWDTLRIFLANYLDTLNISVFTPEWLATLNEFPALLGENPAQYHNLFVLEGDGSVFSEIRERLDIGIDSWLVRQMVMTPFTAVETSDDETFKDNLDSLLLLLNDYPLYAGTGLQVLLDRYTRCVDQSVHAQLRDFSIGLWGNPWLPGNAHQWQCGEPARAMLAHWLKCHLLSEYFTLLSDDDKANSRRLNFWELYCEDFTGMYFALGQDAYALDNMPLYKFRRKAKGLVVKLTDEKRDVHMCIMQLEHHHVIEFNRESNAAYFYDTRQGIPSFYFSKGWVDIGAIGVQRVTEGVDVTRLSTPLRHYDTRRFTWEGRYAQELGVTDNAIKVFCAKYQCCYEDRRSEGAGQWIRPENASQYGAQVWSVLLGWGFALSTKEPGYVRKTGNSQN
jgi:hypothetical protein